MGVYIEMMTTTRRVTFKIRMIHKYKENISMFIEQIHHEESEEI